MILNAGAAKSRLPKQSIRRQVHLIIGQVAKDSKKPGESDSGMSDRAIRFILSFLGAGLLSLCLISAAIRIVFIDAVSLGPVANNLFGLLILALGVYVGVRYALWVDRSWRPVDPTKCRSCGYLLRGLTSLRCPECGTPFELPLSEDD